MIYDRMCDALQEIKVTVSVNTGDQLTGGKTNDLSSSEESRKKSKLLLSTRVICDESA